jgi:hypothetical protein
MIDTTIAATASITVSGWGAGEEAIFGILRFLSNARGGLPSKQRV